MNIFHTITVRTRFEALHRWQDCPHEEVAFLREWHRHLFHVELTLKVDHANRAEEFFIVKRHLDAFLIQWTNEKLDMSCEMMCSRIALAFPYQGYEVYKVTVSEDGENDATLHIKE